MKKKDYFWHIFDIYIYMVKKEVKKRGQKRGQKKRSKKEVKKESKIIIFSFFKQNP